MSGSERDLVVSLRSELAAIDPPRGCDRRAESAGLGASFATREPAVARLAVRLERELERDAGLDGDALPVVTRPAAGRRAYHVRAGATDQGEAFDWDGSADHCRAAYLRGLFLSRGSLSLSASRAHLEFVVPPDAAPVLAGHLEDMGLPAAWRLRRGRGVVTWKSIEAIGTFFRLVGAGGSLLELEARQVARALRGELNRVINAESANIDRAVAASSRQVQAIDRLEQDGRYADLPRATRRVADARRAEPEATLSELAERLGVHRSAVQRALERVESLALHDDEGVGRRATGQRSGERMAADRAARTA